MSIRWLSCGAGTGHIVGPCPSCESTKDGLLVGTVAGTYRGLMTAKCTDCGFTDLFYVDANDGRIWRLQEVKTQAHRET